MALTLALPTEDSESWQADLFSPMATVHDVVAARGVNGAIEAAEYLAFTAHGAPPLSRALAGRMGRQIADNASAAIIREFEGQAQLGYSYSARCLAGLPHRELPPGKNWLISTDFAPTGCAFGWSLSCRVDC